MPLHGSEWRKLGRSFLQMQGSVTCPGQLGNSLLAQLRFAPTTAILLHQTLMGATLFGYSIQ